MRQGHEAMDEEEKEVDREDLARRRRREPENVRNNNGRILDIFMPPRPRRRRSSSTHRLLPLRTNMTTICTQGRNTHTHSKWTEKVGACVFVFLRRSSLAVEKTHTNDTPRLKIEHLKLKTSTEHFRYRHTTPREIES